ncbi:MAG: hypothetical protein ACI4Q3_00065 [Kiritimatiellia bacterium]
MAYQIDFTAREYGLRKVRKTVLRGWLLAALGGIVWGVRHVYKVYNEPTLDMRLAEYESVARPVEEIDAAWDAVAGEYAALLSYYRLIWAANPTNFLNARIAPEAPRLNRAFRPRSWTLKTGGACRLDYVYAFGPGDKAEQARHLEDDLTAIVTSAVEVVDGRVDVQGVRHENLLNVQELNLSVRFALPDARRFPDKEKALKGYVDDIAEFRNTLQSAKLPNAKSVKGGPATVRDLMMQYLTIGRDKPDFPNMKPVFNVAGWLSLADQFIVRHRIPVDADKNRQTREIWHAIGSARYPWQRFRDLDNETLVLRTKTLDRVASGVKRFKVFLDRHRTYCAQKLAPMAEAYAHDDVFNQPLVESDLRDRVAAAAGIPLARVSFEDEKGAASVAPSWVQKNEKFVFSWVRWKLSLLTEAARKGETGASAGADKPVEPIPLERLAACVRMALELGPGYALDAVRITFRDDGLIANAELEGLLPVKKVTTIKER